MSREKIGRREIVPLYVPKEVFKKCEQDDCRERAVLVDLDITEIARPMPVPGTARCANHV